MWAPSEWNGNHSLNIENDKFVEESSSYWQVIKLLFDYILLDPQWEKLPIYQDILGPSDAM